MNRKMLGNNPRYDRKPSSCVIRKLCTVREKVVGCPLKSGGVKSEGVLFYWTPQNMALRQVSPKLPAPLNVELSDIYFANVLNW